MLKGAITQHKNLCAEHSQLQNQSTAGKPGIPSKHWKEDNCPEDTCPSRQVLTHEGRSQRAPHHHRAPKPTQTIPSTIPTTRRARNITTLAQPPQIRAGRGRTAIANPRYSLRVPCPGTARSWRVQHPLCGASVPGGQSEKVSLFVHPSHGAKFPSRAGRSLQRRRWQRSSELRAGE